MPLLVTVIAGDAKFTAEEASIGVWTTKHLLGGKVKLYRVMG